MAEKHKIDWNIVADIGGTNTRVALAQGTEVARDSILKFSNSKYPGLETILREYLASTGVKTCQGACVAVAGPVRDGVGEMTNLEWRIDRAMLSRATGAELVAVLNDLQAQGHALPFIDEDNLTTVVTGAVAKPHAARLVIGLGTGFNAAPVFNAASGILVPPSEAGHANLPIRNEEELRLCRFVEGAHGFPAVEDVLSGRGLAHVYSWLGAEADDPKELSPADIMAALAGGTDERAEKAVRMFIKILGTVAGNLSLIQLPFGGVYLVGGVARAVAPYFERFGFLEAFRDKGRFSGFMGNFPIHVVEDDYAALTGCASHLHHLA